MAIDEAQAREAATNEVTAKLKELYENADDEAMSSFAAAIAEAAVVAVSHIVENARTEISGERIV